MPKTEWIILNSHVLDVGLLHPIGRLRPRVKEQGQPFTFHHFVTLGFSTVTSFNKTPLRPEVSSYQQWHK